MVYLSLIGILAPIVVALFIYYKSKKTRKFSYLIENNTIFDSNVKVDKLNVLYDNVQLTGFSRANILIVNNGQDIISESDISIKEPLRIALPSYYKILDYKILFSGNKGITLDKVSDHEINISFDFLNPKDGFAINLLHNGTPSNKIKLLGRIKQVSDITPITNKGKIFYSIVPYLLIIIAYTLLILPVFFIKYIASIFESGSLMYWSILVLCMVIPSGFIFYLTEGGLSKLSTRQTYIDVLKAKMYENKS